MRGQTRDVGGLPISEPYGIHTLTKWLCSLYASYSKYSVMKKEKGYVLPVLTLKNWKWKIIVYANLKAFSNFTY